MISVQAHLTTTKHNHWYSLVFDASSEDDVETATVDLTKQVRRDFRVKLVDAARIAKGIVQVGMQQNVKILPFLLDND